MRTDENPGVLTFGKVIPADLIRPNEANFYSMGELSELAQSIDREGLIQPVVVREDGDGYVIIDGERRYRAMTEILNRGVVPCIVRKPADEIHEELMLIEANRQQRKMTAADLSKQAERYTELLSRLRAGGAEVHGRLRDRTAEALGVSPSKLARLHAIRANLEPGLLEMFDNGELCESTAYELSKFDHRKQLRVLSMYPDWEPRNIHADMVRLAGSVDEKSLPDSEPEPVSEMDRKTEPEPVSEMDRKTEADELPDDEPLPLLKEAYRRRTSVLNAADDLGFDDLCTAEYMERSLAEMCRTHRGIYYSDTDVTCEPGKIILDRGTRDERRYTIKQFVELAAEMWAEERVRQDFGKPAPGAFPALDWNSTERDGPPPEGALNIICWGDAGLYKPMPHLLAQEFDTWPENCRWWAAVTGPKEGNA